MARKKFISELTDDDLYSDEKISDTPAVDDTQKISDTPAVDDEQKISDEKISDAPAVDDAQKISDTPEKKSEPQRKTFHSKNFSPPIDEEDDDEKNSEPKVKRKISHAETSGIVISIVMLGYSLITEDKPLFFLSTALLIFLLRPIIGGLFGKHNQSVQNALHGFSIALFLGALIFLFL